MAFKKGYRIDVTYVQRKDHYPVDSYLEEFTDREICEETTQSLIPSDNTKHVVSFWYDEEEYFEATIAAGKLMELKTRETVIEHVTINKYTKYLSWQRHFDYGSSVG
jgi:hypothetical protein